jgi:hypothetical protein
VELEAAERSNSRGPLACRGIHSNIPASVYQPTVLFDEVLHPEGTSYREAEVNVFVN